MLVPLIVMMYGTVVSTMMTCSNSFYLLGEKKTRSGYGKATEEKCDMMRIDSCKQCSATLEATPLNATPTFRPSATPTSQDGRFHFE